MSHKSPKLALKLDSPIFEGFALQMVKAGQQRKAKAAATRVLGAKWQVRAFSDTGTDFEVTCTTRKKNALSSARAWEKTYRLRSEPGVVAAEPIFTVPISAPPEFQLEAIDAAFRIASKRTTRAPAHQARAPESVFGTTPLRESDDPAWSIKQVRVPEAWKLFGTDKEPGANVIVAHPDTGYSEHPEIVSRLLIKKGHDYVRNDADAKDDLDSGLLLFPGHGTGTSSVIVSPKGPQGNYGSNNGSPIAVWGVAPGARLIPLRVSRSVVLDVPWAGSGVLNLARAIELAADRGAHVVSMSLGTGFASSRLLKAIQYAQRQGVIILAAAGNYVPFVVWPAAYGDVIAVAASNARRQPWKYSSFGSAVDVTAPGESVWCAGVTRPAQFSIGRGSGTSFAVATVAGIAALWLSHHGRDNLVQRFGAEKIPIIFNRILRDTCDPVPGWKSGFGHGLVNAERVLAASLEDSLTPVPHMASALREHPALDNGGLTTFHHLFETSLTKRRQRTGLAARAAVDTGLCESLTRLLNVTEDTLPARLREVGQELAFHLAANPSLYEQFAQSLSQKKRTPKKAAPGVRLSQTAATGNIEAVRAGLLAESTSKILKGKLS
jgi:serine protease